MKKLSIAVGVAVALVLLAVILWTTSIDLLVARAIERYGSEAFGTEVVVGSVTISAREGRGTIEGLRVAQPEGFGDGDAISIDEITVDLDAASWVDADPGVLELVRVAMPRVNFVVKADRTNNLSVLQENVRRATASAGDAPPPPEAEAETRIRVERLEFEGGRVEADLTALGLGTANAALPPIHEDDLGGAAGAPPGAIAREVANRFLSRTLTTVARSTIGRRFEQLLDEGNESVRGMLDSLFPR